MGVVVVKLETQGSYSVAVSTRDLDSRNPGILIPVTPVRIRVGPMPLLAANNNVFSFFDGELLNGKGGILK